MNYFTHHIGDFTAATQGLTLMERGAYRSLIDQYYAHEAPLSLDASERYRMAVATTPAERKAVDYVVRKFFIEESDGWHQKRCDIELAKYREKGAKASASASTRWAERNANALQTDMRTHSEGNANQEPITNNQEPTKAKSKAKPRREPPSAYSPPDWIPPKAWADFVEFRALRKSPMTVRAMELASAQLDALKRSGHDPTAVLNQSIQNGWRSLYPVKNAVASGGLSAAGEATKNNLDRWMQNEEAKDAAH